ncbi:hypothetical protein M501DRAFT_1013657 [Patellaria atrata CBS 101060]|uniref:C2H2-type domain-containing protein n=1 Tax=Patellaria atrata CBS 101060 TaxID=1346257 RepID=A0A9P4SGX8_9PEZI|nr:hypothetical protein M501DRAFT_1013657 [Patellaria atrata CBS 101060]
MAPNYYSYYNSSQASHNQSDQTQNHTKYSNNTPATEAVQYQYAQLSTAQAAGSHQNYHRQQNYQQDYSWAPSHSSNQDDTSHGRVANAAEVLSNISNAEGARASGVRTPNPIQQYGYQANISTSSSYTPQSADVGVTSNQYPTGQAQTQQSHSAYDSSHTTYSNSHTAYSQRPARTSSADVNTMPHERQSPIVEHNSGHGIPAKSGPQAGFVQAVTNAQHRSASPLQPRAANNTQQSQHVQKVQQRPNSTAPPTCSYSSHVRALPNVLEQQATSAAPQYQYNDRSNATSNAQEFSNPAVTVDPSQVYDPWPEYQRKAEADRAARAVAAAKAAQVAEEERKREEERQAAIAATQKAQEAADAEARQTSSVEQVRAPKQNKPKSSKSTKPKGSKTRKTFKTPANDADTSKEDLEAQMRVMLAKMREFNQKDPQLLAKIWDQERQTLKTQQGGSSKSPQPPQVEQRAAATQSPQIQHRPAPTQPPKAALRTSGSNTVSAPVPNPSAIPSGSKVNLSPTQPSPNSNAVPITVKDTRKSTTVGTIWPPEKKVHLAKAASEWLNAQKGNESKQISGDEICKMLDSNPSYIDLCEILEKMGLTLERAAFARALLTAVPDVNSSASSKPKAHANQPNTSLTRAPLSESAPNGINTPNSVNKLHPSNHLPVPKSVPTSSQAPASQYPQPPTGAHESSYFAGKPTQSPSEASMPSGGAVRPPVPDMISPAQDQQRVRGPARLAQLGSKEKAARKRTFNDIVDLTALSDEEEPEPKRPFLGPSETPVVIANAHLQQNSTPHYLPFPVMQDHFLNPSSAFVQYPPQLHRQTPVPLPSTYLTMPATTPITPDRFENVTLAQQIDRKLALRRSTYNPKTIARDVLLATGRHPEMRPLNGHLENLKESFRQVDYRSDLSTFRWDLVDPGDPPPPDPADVVDDADDEEDDDDNNPIAPAPRPLNHLHQPVDVHVSGVLVRTVTSPSIHSSSGPRKRGRPRRVSLPTGNKSSGSRQNTLSNLGSTNSSPSGIGYSQFRQATLPDGSPAPKKKGRPIGWRKAIHGSGAATSCTTLPTRPSGLRHETTARTGDAGDTNKQEVLNQERLTYKVYKCKWKGCTAELHNIETLRKHVHKLHLKQADHGGFDCLWENCGRKVRLFDKQSAKHIEKHEYFDFPAPADWRVHIEQAHISPLAWAHGDGPAGGLSDGRDSEMSEAYLSDSRGRRVTPTVAFPAPSPISAQPNTSARGRGRPPLPKKTDEEKAQEAQRSIQKKKREIGPGVDRSGATLATEKRRLGFIDDEDDTDIVEDADVASPT